MARTSAYIDCTQRYRECISLLRVALNAGVALTAGSAAKGAIVLAAAAVERFVNDSIREACQRLKTTNFDELTLSQKGYIATQIVAQVATFSNSGNYREFTNDRIGSLKRVLDECVVAFASPSSWSHMPDFGVFLDGAAAPNKIAAIVREFDGGQHDVYAALDNRAAGRPPFLSSLTELVNARHDAAHAKNSIPPSPVDARAWIVASFWLVRVIEAYLIRASPIDTVNSGTGTDFAVS